MRVGDVKRWDVFTLAEELDEQAADTLKIAKSLPKDSDAAEDLFSVYDSLHELTLALFAASSEEVSPWTP